MNTLIIVLVVLPVVAGIVIALYERRKKTTLLRHDFGRAGQPQTEADRERFRATAAMRDRFMFDHFQ